MRFKHYTAYTVLLLFSFSLGLSADQAGRTPAIAKWHQDKKAAVSLRFDDSTESHVTTAIPILNKYGIKATFMINPGRPVFQKYKDFWEKEVPRMGHRLGNHTWHHTGAKTLKEADAEIGSVSRLIWKLYPNDSKLLVFASGGGEKWGGNYWSKADPAFKELVKKYDLIDLYDGHHPYIGANSGLTAADLCRAAEQAVKENKYQAYTFHQIGKPYRTVKSWIYGLLKGHDLTFEKSEFEKFIKCLSEKKDQIWIAPMSDILKYQEEYNGARLSVAAETQNSLVVDLTVATNPKLYDQPLTIMIPYDAISSIEWTDQGGERTNLKWHQSGNEILFDVKPVNGKITVNYAN